MKVLVIGSGAREHALCWKLKQSPLLSELLAAPGNPGMAELGRCIAIAPGDLDALTQLARDECVDLVVVGPEDPLAAGLADRLADAGISVFGPTAAAARLEASKSFAKELMVKAGIPTGRSEVFHLPDEALSALDRWLPPVVIKADGLARGRGVVVALSREQAEDAVREAMIDRAFGDSGASVIFEEYLEGEEVSLIGLSDGRTVLALEPAEDHKQLRDGDRGPNTGGMGCFSPVAAFPDEAARQGREQILQRAVDAMRDANCEFRGALFAGIMLTANGPRVLEYNVRFGDPETEVILPRMKTDLLPLLKACADGCLGDAIVEWWPQPAVAVVLASGGYPGAFEVGKSIRGISSASNPVSTSKDGHEDDKTAPGVVIFHAGTKRQDDELVTAGGRVLVVTALGADFECARRAAYAAADGIHFDGLYRRGDIGRRHDSV